MIFNEIFLNLGIGYKEQNCIIHFFIMHQTNRSLLTTVIFNDHYLFNKSDFIKYADYNIVMTEKDSIKCKELATKNFWVLPLETKVDERLFRNILKKVM